MTIDTVLPVPAEISTAPGERPGAQVTLARTIAPQHLALVPVAELAARELERDGSGRWTVVVPGDPMPTVPVVRLSLDDSEVGRPSIRGVSPAGRDPGDEAHRMIVDADGVHIGARAAEGVWRALCTLRQMVAPSGATAPVSVPGCRVEDAPRFAWRGLSLDVVRTFVPVAEIERIIDLLALYKLNVLHLHLTDDQGWRLEVPGRPALTTVGGRSALAGRPGGWFSTSDMTHLADYAGQRFVTMVPEVDMPGHSAAALTAYPDLRGDDDGFGAGSILHPDRVGVLDLARDALAAAASVTPGPFVHIGGDEAWGMAEAAYDRFVSAARSIVRDLGRRSIGWQESVRAGVGPDDVVQYWLGFDRAVEDLFLAGGTPPADVGIPAEVLETLAESVRVGRSLIAQAVEAGAHVLLSPVSRLYLDRPYAERPDDDARRERRDRLGLKAYGRITVEDAYDWDADAALDIPPASIAGVEAAMWCESIESMEDLEFMLLPRLPGIAQHAWSTSPEPWRQYRDRVGAQSVVWRARDWTWFASPLVDWR